MQKCPVCNVELAKPIYGFCQKCNWDLDNDITLLTHLCEVPPVCRKRYTEKVKLAKSNIIKSKNIYNKSVEPKQNQVFVNKQKNDYRGIFLEKSRDKPKSHRETTNIRRMAIMAIIVVLLLLGVNFLFHSEIQEMVINMSDQFNDSETINDHEIGYDLETTNELVIGQRLKRDFAPDIIEHIYKADYMIDYEHGNIPLYELEIGDLVVDPYWLWEFRTGDDYSYEDGNLTKPVIWIVVAKNHYGIGSGITLLSNELIGCRAFDFSLNYAVDSGYDTVDCSNQWRNSGLNDFECGLRPWLNSTGNYKDDGFYQAFSESFKENILPTSVPNKTPHQGESYTTKDSVFIPSTTELGDTEHDWTYEIGAVYPYFYEAKDIKRKAKLSGERKHDFGLDYWYYWTRSPSHNCVYRVDPDGGFKAIDGACNDYLGVRPALNFNSEVMVTEIN